jgi:hypothetical protein
MTAERPTEQFVTAGGGFGLIFAFAGAAAVGHLPFAASWLIETAVTAGGFTAMTLYKRNRWGWAWTSYVALVCLAEAFAYVTGLSTSHLAGGLAWAAGGLIAVGWMCMLKLERNRRTEPLPVQHVVYHHVVHGTDAGGLPGTVPGEVIQVPDMPGVRPARQRRAIAAPRARRSSRGARIFSKPTRGN